MKSKALILVLLGMAIEAIPSPVIAKYVKVYGPPATERTVFLDDEKVYRIKTSTGRQGEFYYDAHADSFVSPHSKKKLDLAQGERITDVSIVDGLMRSGTVVGYVELPIRQGTTVFGYPFDDWNVDKNVSSNLLTVAVDGDRMMYQSRGTNYCFVAVYSAQDNSLRWHKNESFEVCQTFPIPDADKFFYYSRMQDIHSKIAFSGGRQLKTSGVIYFRDHEIEEAYRIFAQCEFENDVDLSKNLLGGALALKSDTPKLSVLNPKKFYVVLKSGHRAFGMFQSTDKYKRCLFSPITSAPLAVSPSDIVGFEAIRDNAFPQSECYTKNEVERLYEQYTENKEDSFRQRALRQSTGEFWDSEHPVRSVVWKLFYIGMFWAIVLTLKRLFRGRCICLFTKIQIMVKPFLNKCLTRSNGKVQAEGENEDSSEPQGSPKVNDRERGQKTESVNEGSKNV
jgi:hypothetical protein